MSVYQIFAICSTVFFVLFGVMLSTNSFVGMSLKATSFIMALFGVVMILASSGIVLANGIRLI